MASDPLVDRKCILLDGACDCEWPKDDCKYVSIRKELWPKNETSNVLVATSDGKKVN